MGWNPTTRSGCPSGLGQARRNQSREAPSCPLHSYCCSRLPKLPAGAVAWAAAFCVTAAPSQTSSTTPTPIVSISAAADVLSGPTSRLPALSFPSLIQVGLRDSGREPAKGTKVHPPPNPTPTVDNTHPRPHFDSGKHSSRARHTIRDQGHTWLALASRSNNGGHRTARDTQQGENPARLSLLA